MIKKIRSLIFKVIYILLFIYVLVFLPCIFGYHPLVIISNSMHPTLNVGGVMYYHKENFENLIKDDILVYKAKDHIISHRIVEIFPDSFITKGDANQSNDSFVVNHQQVLGKGTNWCIPWVGYYVDFIYNHKFLIYILAIYLISDLSIDCIKNFRKRNKKLYEET